MIRRSATTTRSAVTSVRPWWHRYRRDRDPHSTEVGDDRQREVQGKRVRSTRPSSERDLPCSVATTHCRQTPALRASSAWLSFGLRRLLRMMRPMSKGARTFMRSQVSSNAFKPHPHHPVRNRRPGRRRQSRASPTREGVPVITRHIDCVHDVHDSMDLDASVPIGAPRSRFHSGDRLACTANAVRQTAVTLIRYRRGS